MRVECAEGSLLSPITKCQAGKEASPDTVTGWDWESHLVRGIQGFCVTSSVPRPGVCLCVSGSSAEPDDKGPGGERGWGLLTVTEMVGVGSSGQIECGHVCGDLDVVTFAWSRGRTAGAGDRGSEDHGDGGGSQTGGLAWARVTGLQVPPVGTLRPGRAARSSRAPRPPGHRDPLPASLQRGGAGRRRESAPEAGAGPGGGGGASRDARPAPLAPSPTPPCLLGLGRWGLISRLRSILRRASRFSCFSFASRRDSFCSREDAAIFPAAAAHRPAARQSGRQTPHCACARMTPPSRRLPRHGACPRRAPALPS